MAHVQSSVASVRIDDSTASIVVISGSVNTVSVEGGQELVEDTGMGDTRRSVLAGLSTATIINLNGFLDSTSEAIWAPVLDGTSITKTIGIGLVSGQYLNGEAWPENVTLGSNAGELTTWSASMKAQDGLTRTSVVAA
jgi:hypothetical protein